MYGRTVVNRLPYKAFAGAPMGQVNPTPNSGLLLHLFIRSTMLRLAFFIFGVPSTVSSVLRECHSPVDRIPQCLAPPAHEINILNIPMSCQE